MAPTATTPQRRVKRFGCLDCGATFERKRDVPERCQPYTWRVVRNDQAFGGYEATEQADF